MPIQIIPSTIRDYNQSSNSNIRFKSPDVEDEYNNVNPLLKSKIEGLGMPLTITSGKRSLEENELVGGMPNSGHLTGNKVDIRLTEDIPGLTKKLKDAGLNPLVESDHVDVGMPEIKLIPSTIRDYSNLPQETIKPNQITKELGYQEDPRSLMQVFKESFGNTPNNAPTLTEGMSSALKMSNPLYNLYQYGKNYSEGKRGADAVLGEDYYNVANASGQIPETIAELPAIALQTIPYAGEVAREGIGEMLGTYKRPQEYGTYWNPDIRDQTIAAGLPLLMGPAAKMASLAGDSAASFLTGRAERAMNKALGTTLSEELADKGLAKEALARGHYGSASKLKNIGQEGLNKYAPLLREEISKLQGAPDLSYLKNNLINVRNKLSLAEGNESHINFIDDLLNKIETDPKYTQATFEDIQAMKKANQKAVGDKNYLKDNPVERKQIIQALAKGQREALEAANPEGNIAELNKQLQYFGGLKSAAKKELAKSIIGKDSGVILRGAKDLGSAVIGLLVGGPTGAAAGPVVSELGQTTFGRSGRAQLYKKLANILSPNVDKSFEYAPKLAKDFSYLNPLEENISNKVEDILPNFSKYFTDKDIPILSKGMPEELSLDNLIVKPHVIGSGRGQNLDEILKIENNLDELMNRPNLITTQNPEINNNTGNLYLPDALQKAVNEEKIKQSLIKANEMLRRTGRDDLIFNDIPKGMEGYEDSLNLSQDFRDNIKAGEEYRNAMRILDKKYLESSEVNKLGRIEDFIENSKKAATPDELAGILNANPVDNELDLLISGSRYNEPLSSITEEEAINNQSVKNALKKADTMIRKGKRIRKK